MPCVSDHMEPTRFELEASRIECLLDEISGIPFNKNHWGGFHPRAYCQGIEKSELDALTAKLCSRLKRIDVKNYSLEMQMWKRDHDRIDAEREAREKKTAENAATRKKALSKLTAEEKRALGVK